MTPTLVDQLLEEADYDLHHETQALLTAAANRIMALEALSVTNILLAVTPGDGSGLEVYAKSVSDVVDKLASMDERLEAIDAAKPVAHIHPRHLNILKLKHTEVPVDPLPYDNGDGMTIPLYAHPVQQSVPHGFTLVPITATADMIAAAEEVEDLYRRGTPDTWAKVYRVMVAAGRGAQL